MMHWRSLLLVALLAETPLQVVGKEPPVLPPPMAEPANLSIFRGRSVEVPLRAQGRTPGQLRFYIRSYPSKGWLGEIRITGRKSAVVTYTHDGSPEESDMFTFAVQALDSPVSAAAPINVAISEEPPALSVVHAVDFGTVLLGETHEEQITVRNSGGGVLAGEMEVPWPWKILGSAEYRLGQNQERKVCILYAPETEQEHSGKLTFSHDARSAVELSAKAISPFEFAPAREIELAVQDGSSERSGSVVIRNGTARDRTLEVSVPPQISSPDQITVAAGEEKRIVLRTEPEFLGALEGVVRFESEEFGTSIPLRVFALPPMLRIQPREGLDFGDIEYQRRHKGVLRIKNEGGSAARLRTAMPKEILLVPDPNKTLLGPGETGLFEVDLYAFSIGSYRSRIVVEAEAGEPASIEITGQVIAQGTEARKIPTSTLTSPSQDPSHIEAASEQSLSAVPPVSEIQVLKATNRIFEIGWKKPSEDLAGSVIQQRQFDMESGEVPKMVWRDLRDIKFLEENGMIIARFENLAPGQVWLLRIISIDKEGRRSVPSPTIRLSSAPPKRTSVLWWLAGILGLGLLAFGVSRLRARREVESDNQADRITRIESR
jgi:hypothetical protein